MNLIRVRSEYRLLAALIAVAFGAACAPTASQLKSTMEQNPDIIYAAVRKDPAKFMEVLEEASIAAKNAREQNALADTLKAPPMNPKISEDRVIDGAKDAPVTIVEYSDLQCPYCSQGHMVMADLMKQYPGKIRVVFKNFPMDRLHPLARKMASLYEAMATKDRIKASTFKTKLFERQRDFAPNEKERAAKTREAMVALYNKRAESDLAAMVKEAGFDYATIKKIAASDVVTKRIAADESEAREFGFTGTPGYLINGAAIRGLMEIEEFKTVIDHQLSKTTK